MLNEIPNAPAEIMQLDLANLDSVRSFAEAFKTKFNRLDLLINNAGIMWVPYATTADGFESTFGTNHLGHFALTGLLVDFIAKTPEARVVTVSSAGHRAGAMDFLNLMFEDGEGYSRYSAYSRSKLANLLFTYELQRRFEEAGYNAFATAAHPGGSNTGSVDHVPGVRLLRQLLGWVVQSAAMGALPTLRAAVDPEIKGGEYFGPGGFKEQRGYPILVQSSEASYNLKDAKRLWKVSEELTGVEFVLPLPKAGLG
jgi:NAD(P)-dependent dehydrogenase (short-subunit alcohol dehydrogenase family)